MLWVTLGKYTMGLYLRTLTSSDVLHASKKRKDWEMSIGPTKPYDTEQTGVFIFFILFNLIEKEKEWEGGGKHRALIHRAHRILSWERWERPLFVHSYHRRSRFQARLGLSRKIRWNQSVLNLLCGRGLDRLMATFSRSPALLNETIRNTSLQVFAGMHGG